MSNGMINAIGNGAALTYGRNAIAETRPVAEVSAAKAEAADAGSATTAQTIRAATSERGDAVAASPGNTAEAIKQVKEYVRQVVPELDFSVDEDTGKVVVKLMDTETNEVLRQIPSEEMLHVAKMLDKLQGLLYRGRA